MRPRFSLPPAALPPSLPAARVPGLRRAARRQATHTRRASEKLSSAIPTQNHLPEAEEPRPRLGTYPSRRLPGEVHGVDADGDGGHPLLGFPEVVSERGHLPFGHDQNVLLEACERQRSRGWGGGVGMSRSPAGPGSARRRAPARHGGGGGSRPGVSAAAYR